MEKQVEKTGKTPDAGKHPALEYEIT